MGFPGNGSSYAGFVIFLSLMSFDFFIYSFLVLLGLNCHVACRSL